jgi:tetratricopeptide (TPR) repeat protein
MSDQQTPPPNGTGGGNGEARRLRAEVRRLRSLVDRLSRRLGKVRQVKLDSAQLKRIGRYTGITALIGTLLTVSLPLVLEPLYTDHIKRQLMSGLRDNYKEMASTIYFRDGNLDVAQELIDKAIETDARDAESRYIRAFLSGMDTAYALLNLDRSLTETEQDEAHRALADAEFLINADAKDPRGHLLRGQVFMALERYTEAYDTLQTARRLAERRGETAIEALARWRIGATQLEEARKDDTGLAETLNRTSDDLYNQGMRDLTIAISLFKAGAGSAREAAAGKWPRLWRGIAKRDHRFDLDGAIEEFELALDEDPNFALAHFNIGEATLMKWMMADRSTVPPREIAALQNNAIESFEAARQADAGLPQAYFGLGFLFGADVKYGVAVRYFDKALGLNPNYLRALLYRGQAYHEMGQYDRAIADFDRAIDLEPSEGETFVHRARAEIARGQLTQARTDLEQARAIGNAGRYLELTEGELALVLGQTARALSKVQDGLDKAESRGTAADFGEAYELRSRALFEEKRERDAVEAMNQAVARSSYRPARFLLARGCLLYRLGLDVNALTDFSMALLEEPDYRPAQYAEAEMLTRLGVQLQRPRLPEGTDRVEFWRLNEPYVRLCGFAERVY